MLLCMFRDLREAVDLNGQKENEKSKCLRKHCKAVMLPDRLAEAVDRRVKYVEKWVSERIFIILINAAVQIFLSITACWQQKNSFVNFSSSSDAAMLSTYLSGNSML